MPQSSETHSERNSANHAELSLDRRLQSVRRYFHSRGAKPLQYVPAYVAGGLLIFFVLWAVAGFLLPPEAPRLWGQLLAEMIFAIAAIAPAFVVSKVEERDFGAYGLPGRAAFGRLFWTGVLWGLIALSVLLLLLRVAGAITFSGVALHGARISKFGLFWAVFFLLVGFYEEFAFRGYLLFAFSETVGFWPAAVTSSIFFGYVHHHNPGENWAGALGAAAIGIFFCFTLRRTGSLWFAVGMHSAWDWAETFLYSVPDSGVVLPGHLLKTSLHGPAWLTGGSVGPEGSILLFILVAALCITLDRIYPAAKYGVRNSSPIAASTSSKM